LATSPALLSAYQSLSESVGKPILMGCFWKDGDATTNSAVLLDETSCSEPYSKRILVPFGERMPYRAVLAKLFPFLEEINMLSSDLAAGKDSALMDFNGHKLGAVICFESVFPELVRDSVRDGAEMLVIVTNDSWYEDSPAVWQHLAHATFRSVENGRATVRCANSGVSAFIDEKGRILSELGPLEQGILTDTVSFSSETTLYSVLGDFVLPTGFALWLVWLFVLILMERKNHGRER
jgi:apolipoprotein N-acyltransferase